jgi:hypothetical protein
VDSNVARMEIIDCRIIACGQALRNDRIRSC